MQQPVAFYETDVLGTAYTSVIPGYSGHCALQCVSGSGRLEPRVVFPTADEAHAAARFAVNILGGFVRADVTEARDELPTHPSWMDWAF